MRIYITYILLILIGLSNAQEADSIVKKHIEATGGTEKWNQLNSIIIEGEVIFALDQRYKIKIYHKRPYYKKVVYVINGIEFLSEGFDGKNGWTFNEELQKNIIVSDFKEDSFENDLLNYQAKGFKVNFLREEKHEDKTCLIVELLKNKNRNLYCFNKENYELIWEENSEEVQYFNETIEVEGLKFPKRIVNKTSEGSEYSIIFDKIEINPHLADRLFKFKN